VICLVLSLAFIFANWLLGWNGAPDCVRENFLFEAYRENFVISDLCEASSFVTYVHVITSFCVFDFVINGYILE